MKAFLVSEYAHPSQIQLTHDAPEPVLTPGSEGLLIDVHSAGLNFFDVRLFSLRPPIFSTRMLDFSHDRGPIPYNCRYYNARESIKRNPRVLSCSAPNLPEPLPLRLQGAHTSLAIAYLGVRKARTASASSRIRSMCCLCRMHFHLTKELVRREK
jgi:hypothetical protein